MAEDLYVGRCPGDPANWPVKNLIELLGGQDFNSLDLKQFVGLHPCTLCLGLFRVYLDNNALFVARPKCCLEIRPPSSKNS